MVVVVEGDQCPIGDHADDADTSIGGWASDQVFHACGIEELDVWHGQDLAHQGAHEQGGVLDDDIVAFILEGHADVVQEFFCRLAEDHGREELTT